MAGDELTKEKLESAGAVLALGSLAVRSLQEHGVVTLFVNSKGAVELCPPGEIELDQLPEEEAVAVLVGRGYEDGQLMAYLKGRDARCKRAQEKSNG